MSGYELAQLYEIEEQDDGRQPWRPVRMHLGITAFGVTAWTGRAAGDRIINEHDESDDGSEELYLVLHGRAAFELDGERRDAPAGTFVFVKPGVRRTAFAEEPGTTIVAVGGEPGDYAGAATRGRELVESHPEYAALFYNLACCESLAGDADEAVAHLRRAIELSERFRAYAAEDSDFDPIREQPAFAELVAG